MINELKSKKAIWASVLLGAAIFLTGAPPSVTAPSQPLKEARPVARSATAVAAVEPTLAEPEATVSERAGNDAACSRGRKRLWVEGEGWVVRRVTQCR